MRLGLIDRYLVTETLKRLAVALAVVLLSLVIERVLRLFDVVTLKGGPVSMVWEMALMLVPHYLGLALPAGFFVSIFLVVARFGEENEFDALMSCGLSPARFGVPFLGMAVVLVGVSVGLYGYAQPYSRYAYRAVNYLVQNIPWGASIPEMSFAKVDKDATVSADRVEGGVLKGVFIRMMQDGHEVVMTAARAQLVFSVRHTSYRLRLFDGIQVVEGIRGGSSATHFDEILLEREFVTDLPLFRERGDDVRELTLGELAHERYAPDGTWSKAEAGGELHARLTRAVSLLFLPFLTIPVASAAKRHRRGAGMLVGGVALLIYHYVLQTLEGMSELGRAPVAALWIAMTVFAVLSLALFWRMQRHPGESPLDGLFAACESLIEAVRSMSRRALNRPTGQART